MHSAGESEYFAMVREGSLSAALELIIPVDFWLVAAATGLRLSWL